MQIMKMLSEWLWGQRARLSYLMLASAVLLFAALGGRDIWTQEHRWADIVFGMFYRQDFLHPYLGEARYYDKPLLSYWLIALVAKLTGSLTVWSLRVPSALAGLLSVWSIYRLGLVLKNRQFGLMAGWLLLTTFYFLFWARTSSADMLNLAGSLFAVLWYMNHRERAGFFAYAVFFCILALTSLCKGLGGAIIPLIAVFADMILQGSWRQHLRPVLFLSLMPAAIIYLLPFLASSYYGGEAYGQSGLYLVYRENILRYFQPFDHKGPIYTYFIYLPVYTLPWAVFLIPAVWSLKSRWKGMSLNTKWIALTLCLLFAFFTLSGSRRSYYVLPMVPFAILLIADWLQTWLARSGEKAASRLAKMTGITFLLLFLGMDVLPAWYYSQAGVSRFAVTLQKEAEKIKPWSEWRVVMLDAETKLNFYLKLPPSVRQYDVSGERKSQTMETLSAAWPISQLENDNTIFVSRKRYAGFLQSRLPGYRMVESAQKSGILSVKSDEGNMPVAFVPYRT